jgi:hypothetical protein
MLRILLSHHAWAHGFRKLKPFEGANQICIFILCTCNIVFPVRSSPTQFFRDLSSTHISLGWREKLIFVNAVSLEIS